MNIAQEIRQIKTLMTQGAQLLMLRLRLLRLDLGAQVTDIIIVLAMLAVIAVALLVGLISLLFGLQAVLPEVAKPWVFFGVCTVCLLAIVLLAWRIPSILQRNVRQISQTLGDMQDDLNRLCETVSPDDLSSDIVEGERYDP